MAADRTHAFFQELAARGHEPLLAKADGTIRFDLTHGAKRERWLVTMRKGHVSVSRRNSGADCSVRADKTFFSRIVTGEANAMAAVLRGELALEGDLELLLRFQRLFPGPPGARGPERGVVVEAGRS